MSLGQESGSDRSASDLSSLAELDTSVVKDLYRLALEKANLGIWIVDLASDRVVFDERSAEIAGLSPHEAISLAEARSYMHPDDRKRAEGRYGQILSPEHAGPYDTMMRIIRPDGTVRWVNVRGQMHRRNGQSPQVVGVIADVTERQQLEQELREVRRELLSVQEEERQRIAQELHDTLGGQLAGLALVLSEHIDRKKEGHDLPLGPLKELETAVKNSSRQLRAISRGLHPGKLDDRTLAEALGERVDQTRDQFAGACTYKADSHLPTLSATVATHLYHIGQEALINAVRHAGASAIRVTLESSGDAVVLSVEDDGDGFDAGQASGQGIGLRSMDYRARLIGADLEITSGSAGGTLVRCRYPVSNG